MWRGIVVLAVMSVAVVSFASVIGAADHTTADVRAHFAGMTQADIEALGYVESSPCIDAGELPPPVLADLGIPASSGMGIHFINGALIDDTLSALEPESIQLSPDGTIWNVEYITTAQDVPQSIFGQQLAFSPPAGGDAIHLWMIDNPSGEFAGFNPAVNCGNAPVAEATGGDAGAEAAPVSLPSTGSGGLAGGSDGSTGVWLALALAGVAATMTVVSTAVLRRRTR